MTAAAAIESRLLEKRVFPPDDRATQGLLVEGLGFATLERLTVRKWGQQR